MGCLFCPGAESKKTKHTAMQEKAKAYMSKVKQKFQTVITCYRDTERSDWLRSFFLVNPVLRRIAVMAVVVFGVILVFSTTIQAQSGVITGKVVDAHTGEPLYGAELLLNQHDLKSKSDEDGRFVIRRAPSGEQALVVNHIGYEETEIAISVSEQTLILDDIELEGVFTGGDRIFEEGRKRGEFKAISRMRSSGGIRYILASEQMDRLGYAHEYTVGDIAARLPGVQLGYHGDINIRGIGQAATGASSMFNVSMDGQRMASTGFGTRSVNLSMIPIDQIEQIELLSTLTPDMYADAPAGEINIISKRPVTRQRQITAQLGSGMSIPDDGQLGLGRRISLSYVDPLEDSDFSVTADFAHQQNYAAAEALGMNFNVVEFDEEGAHDVLNRFSNEVDHGGHSTYGGRFEVKYEPSELNSYFIRGMYNSNNRGLDQHGLYRIAGNQWENPHTNTQGSYQYNIASNKNSTQHLTLNSGARHYLDHFDIAYHAGWSYSIASGDILETGFSDGGYTFNIDMEDRHRPLVDQTEGSLRAQDLALGPVFDTDEKHRDSKLSSGIDVTIPLGMLSLKLGSAALISSKDGEFRTINVRIPRPSTPFDFDPIKNSNLQVFNRDQYNIPHPINPDDMRAFVSGSETALRRDITYKHEHSDIRNYEADENIYSGYGMFDINLGDLVLSAGARIEHTRANYSGKLVEINHLGFYRDTEDTTASQDYTHIFPNVHLLYTLFDNTDIKAAYTRSITRPDYYNVTPFSLIHEQDQTLYLGNSALEPVVSDNIDLSVSRYINDSGWMGIHGFYKQLTNLIRQRFTEVEEVEGDDVTVWSKTTYTNGNEEATIFGAGVSVQQHLNFLPGLLSNLSLYGNYTWSQSEFDVATREGKIGVPGHSPHVINAALDYTSGRFSGQVSYHLTSSSLSNISENAVAAPSITGNEDTYLDQFSDGAHDLSLSFRFKVSENFRIWADASNLLPVENHIYDKDRQYYPRYIQQSRGRQFKLGLRYHY